MPKNTAMKRLAIIGGGIAGVSAAYLFQDRYQVTLFERNDYLGGNNRSIDIGQGVKVPLAVILFPRKQIFTHTIGYIRKFGLPLKKKFIGHTFLQDGKVKYESSLHPLGWIHNLRTASLSTMTKDFLYIFTGFKGLRFGRGKLVRDLKADGKISEPFINTYLIPLACLYLSMSFEDVLNLPLEVFSDWFYKYLLVRPWAPMQFSFIAGGNHQLVEAFLKRTQVTTQLNSQIRRVERDAQGITIVTPRGAKNFDKVIFATLPHEVLAILAKPTRKEQSLLGKIQPTGVTCMLHTDFTKAIRGNITMNVVSQGEKKTVVTTFSEECFNYKLKKKHFISIEPEGTHAIHPRNIIHQQHLKVPKVSPELFEVMDQFPSLNQNRLNTYYCGAYFGKYFYHEDAIASAIAINEQDRIE